jgi:hypothetical protein
LEFFKTGKENNTDIISKGIEIRIKQTTINIDVSK